MLEETSSPSRQDIFDLLELLHTDKALEGFNGLKRIVVEFPHSSVCDDALYFLGVFYAHKQQEDKALACMQRLIRSYPGSNMIHFARAWREKLSRNSAPELPEFLECEEAFFNKNIFVADRMLKEFSERHPKSVLADNALLLRAILWKNHAEFSGEEQGFETAKSLIQTILQEYPSSDAADFARQFDELSVGK